MLKMTGQGSRQEERDKIFERFYRLSRDQNREGSGLGLSIVLALAKRIGALLDVADGDDGRGLRVTVRFPMSSLKGPRSH